MTQMGEVADRAAAAAKWLVEALESGNPLAPLPEGLAPRDAEEGFEMAAAVLEETGQAPCGLRMMLRGMAPPILGPMPEGRLMADGATVALAGLRHPCATGAVVGVLAEALEPGSDAPPVLARLHPAIDIAATRFTDMPSDPAVLTADLGGLGYVVTGKARPPSGAEVAIHLGAPDSRRRGMALDLAPRFAEAAAAARGLGGLPAGALLVVAGLTLGVVPEPGTALATRISGLGRAMVRFV
ncbi:MULTISPECIES: hypothetical protein [Roseomonadaceae]|uniref:4-oxalocrotonate decarboxylase n=1 Tax=Falsiroseomonas oleicola TaxID=2801474 RepID=A0ABS6H1Q0_9PROT|nr:hypothetical protein [Roseomonas oleicola]MBU8542316.1 hypothetical protein [Roseomonas oleicola]